MYVPPDSFPELLDGLRTALAGDDSVLIDMGGLRVDPDSDPSNMLNALYAINCCDSTPTPDVSGSAQLAAQWDADTPIFGSANAWGLRCSTFAAHDPVGPQRVRRGRRTRPGHRGVERWRHSRALVGRAGRSVGLGASGGGRHRRALGLSVLQPLPGTSSTRIYSTGVAAGGRIARQTELWPTLPQNPYRAPSPGSERFTLTSAPR